MIEIEYIELRDRNIQTLDPSFLVSNISSLRAQSVNKQRFKENGDLGVLIETIVK